MLSEFQKQVLQLPLIATSWPSVRIRYVQEKKNLSFPTRFIVSFIEHTIVFIYGKMVQPLFPECPYFHWVVSSIRFIFVALIFSDLH